MNLKKNKFNPTYKDVKCEQMSFEQLVDSNEELANLNKYNDPRLEAIDANARAALSLIRDSIESTKPFDEVPWRLIPDVDTTHPIIVQASVSTCVLPKSSQIITSVFVSRAVTQLYTLISNKIVDVYRRVYGESPSVVGLGIVHYAIDEYAITIEHSGWRWLYAPNDKIIFDNKKLILTDNINIVVNMDYIKTLHALLTNS